jgi:hypothetical protein
MAVAIPSLFIENPDDVFDKSTATFIDPDISEYTVYLAVYKINTTADPTHPFLQYLCMTDQDNLTFSKTTYTNSNYPPNENPDDSPIDAHFKDEMTKFLLDTTQLQIQEFDSIYRGVIPMSMDVKTNRILFVFIDVTENVDLSTIPENQTWKLCTDLAGYWIGLEKQPPIIQVDENIKILFDEHYEISIIKHAETRVVLKSPVTVYLCKYDDGSRQWSNIAASEMSNRGIILRQDHPFGYYPFVSMNVISTENEGSLIKYALFVETMKNTLYILQRVEGGDDPSQIDLYDGSVFEATCLEEGGSDDDNEDGDEGPLKQKKYSTVYFVDQGNLLWCVKNLGLLVSLDA